MIGLATQFTLSSSCASFKSKNKRSHQNWCHKPRRDQRVLYSSYSEPFSSHHSYLTAPFVHKCLHGIGNTLFQKHPTRCSNSSQTFSQIPSRPFHPSRYLSRFFFIHSFITCHETSTHTTCFWTVYAARSSLQQHRQPIVQRTELWTLCWWWWGWSEWPSICWWSRGAKWRSIGRIECKSQAIERRKVLE